MKFKISGEIEAENEEEARFKATVEGGHDILEFEEVLTCAYCENLVDEIDNENSKGQKICSDCFFTKTDNNNDLVVE